MTSKSLYKINSVPTFRFTLGEKFKMDTGDTKTFREWVELLDLNDKAYSRALWDAITKQEGFEIYDIYSIVRFNNCPPLVYYCEPGIYYFEYMGEREGESYELNYSNLPTTYMRPVSTPTMVIENDDDEKSTIRKRFKNRYYNNKGE